MPGILDKTQHFAMLQQSTMLGWSRLNRDILSQHLRSHNECISHTVLMQTIGPSHLAAYHGHLLVPQQQFKGLYAINISLWNSIEHQYNVSALWQLIRHVVGPASVVAHTFCLMEYSIS